MMPWDVAIQPLCGYVSKKHLKLRNGGPRAAIFILWKHANKIENITCIIREAARLPHWIEAWLLKKARVKARENWQKRALACPAFVYFSG